MNRSWEIYIYDLFTDQQAFTDNTWKLHINCERLYVWKLQVYLKAHFFH